MLKSIFAIFLGGGIGSVLRYSIQMLLHERIIPYNFPWATLTVNIVGCFLIGLFYALSDKLSLSPEIRLLLTAGLCGGFTTFSTFSNDIVELIRQGEVLFAAIYILASILLGVAACFAGTALVKA